MTLGLDLISQFVKATKDTEQKKTETIVYGTAKIQNGIAYVQFDGSDTLTPVITTADVKDGERVTVMIKNHTAVVTGNISSPAARSDDVKDIVDAGADYKAIKKVVDELVVDVEKCANDIDNIQKNELQLRDTMSEHETTMSAISLKQNNIDNKLLDYDKTLTEVESSILSIKLTNQNQDKKITSIENKLTEQATSIESIDKMLKEQAASIESINDTLKEQSDSIASINERLDDIITRLEALEIPEE